MTIKTLLAAASVAALLAGPALAQTNGKTQRDDSRADRAAQTNPNNDQGRTNANENAGFGAGSTTPDTGGQDGAIREGVQIRDGPAMSSA
jgi:Ni/Co efflux regulator RcnB